LWVRPPLSPPEKERTMNYDPGIVVTGPGKEFKRMKNGKAKDPDMTCGKCTECGKSYYRAVATTGVFVHRCEECEKIKKKEADKIGKVAR